MNHLKQKKYFSSKKGALGWFPTKETHSKYEVDGVPYEKLHIVNIKATPNNTIINLTDSKGFILFSTSAVIILIIFI